MRLIEDDEDAHDLLLGEAGDPPDLLLEDKFVEQLPTYATRLLPLLRFLPIHGRSTSRVQSSGLLILPQSLLFARRHTSPLPSESWTKTESCPSRHGGDVRGQLGDRVSSDAGCHVIQRRRIGRHCYGTLRRVFLV